LFVPRNVKRKPLAAAIRDGDVVAQPCDRCGGEGQPLVRRRDARTVEVAGWRCFRCRHLPEGAYYVYVVELAKPAGKRAVYVGQSALFPAERFSQHLTGYKAASVVRRFGSHLRPDLFQPFNPIPTRADAEAMEARLAERLSAQGYRVYGGH
jgi:hypothetical protein